MKNLLTERSTYWLGIYHHRHGEDYALFDSEPTERQMLKYWEQDFEVNREDEWFESYCLPLPIIAAMAKRIDVGQVQPESQF